MIWALANAVGDRVEIKQLFMEENIFEEITFEIRRLVESKCPQSDLLFDSYVVFLNSYHRTPPFEKFADLENSLHYSMSYFNEFTQCRQNSLELISHIIEEASSDD